MPHLDLVTPAGEVAEGLDRHTHVGLEGQGVHGPRVHGLNGGQLLLVFLHKISQSWRERGKGRERSVRERE